MPLEAGAWAPPLRWHGVPSIDPDEAAWRSHVRKLLEHLETQRTECWEGGGPPLWRAEQSSRPKLPNPCCKLKLVKLVTKLKHFEERPRRAPAPRTRPSRRATCCFRGLFACVVSWVEIWGTCCYAARRRQCTARAALHTAPGLCALYHLYMLMVVNKGFSYRTLCSVSSAVARGRSSRAPPAADRAALTRDHGPTPTAAPG